MNQAEILSNSTTQAKIEMNNTHFTKTTANCPPDPDKLFEQFFTAKPLQTFLITKKKSLHYKEFNLPCSITITYGAKIFIHL